MRGPDTRKRREFVRPEMVNEFMRAVLLLGLLLVHDEAGGCSSDDS